MNHVHTDSVTFGAKRKKFGNWNNQAQNRAFPSSGRPPHYSQYNNKGPQPSHQVIQGNRGSVLGNKRPNTYYCDHCKMSGHSMERSWKLNDFPANYKPNIWKRNASHGGNAKLVQIETQEVSSEMETASDSDMITTILTPAKYKQLMTLVNKSEVSDAREGTTNIAMFAGICQSFTPKESHFFG